jgi:hypothetical protein
MAETAVVQTTACLLMYTAEGKWAPQGPANGMSRIYLYRNESPRAYRIVSRNAQDKAVSVFVFFLHPPDLNVFLDRGMACIPFSFLIHP